MIDENIVLIVMTATWVVAWICVILMFFSSYRKRYKFYSSLMVVAVITASSTITCSIIWIISKIFQ